MTGFFWIALIPNTVSNAANLSIVPVPKSTSGDTTTNLALIATASTSFVSSWEDLEAVHDDYDPASSSDKRGGAYGNWNGEASYNTYNWVQYDWNLAQQIDSTWVYWWDDGQGIDQPTDAYIEYWDGNEWINAGSIGLALNQYNKLGLDLWVNKLRINMVSAMATGILEWKVFGIESEPCDSAILTPYLGINNDSMMMGNTAIVRVGDTVHFDLLPADSTGWNWTGPDGFNATDREVILENVQTHHSGTYFATYLNDCGAYSTQYFNITVLESSDGDPYTWPAYEPTLNYNFRDEFPALDTPTMDLDDCEGVVGTQSSGWWTFKWGASANPLVTSAAITPLLERMNKDFAYFRDSMGWPPDKRAKHGYRSAIYLYGSGLCTDDAPNTEKGGWQSTIWYNEESWPMVLLSYYPVYCFDPSCPYSDIEYQTGACVHEGIHAILADLPGCKNAAWFHEGGNTWLQQEADARRSGDYSTMGYLNGCTFLAPFMPIECYSGWLQDNSFGGPSAEGVNKYEGSTQLCTWRNYLGGNQYGNSFPVFLGMTLGQGSIPWIWRYCESRVLEGIADSLGDSQMRRLITEYRAKQALVDMGKWTGAIKKLLDTYFWRAIRSEWKPTWLNPEVWYATPYVKTTNDGNGLLTPEYRITPGWSGANQIPLHVNGDKVIINFQPYGTNMTCQLCYRDTSGSAVYSAPVYGGDCALKLDKVPANGVVFAVITNTDYIYKGEATRTAHYDYRIQLVEGVERTASVNLRWYDWTKVILDTVTVHTAVVSTDLNVIIYPNPVAKNGLLTMEIPDIHYETASIRISNMQGQLVYSNKINRSHVEINTSALLKEGLYIITVKTPTRQRYLKLVVE
ncbi:MAG: T9SS type A sorting domain-containing protein [Bacteroidales bacterium]|nr:T9SS type A sorting domain-containing protein [Bacteroidales bacterium]